MCTAITYKTQDHYFGRNLDLERGYGEQIAVTPRNFPLIFRQMGEMKRHYAMIGMAHMEEGYPLYYEATNQKGLSMAGLNFPGNAVYFEPRPGKDNLAPFEFIPWVLGQCATLAEAKELLERVNLADIPFGLRLPLTPLHWMAADQTGAVVVEQTARGLEVYENPVEVLTNNPPFGWHMTNLCRYMGLSSAQPQSRFAPNLDLRPHSRGMGSLGLPGDYSSPSRFVRAAFVRSNSRSGSGEAESVAQFFHILDGVAMPRGCVQTEGEEYEITRYSCCCNTTKGIYYYTTYANSGITAVEMHREDPEGDRVVCYPLLEKQQVEWQNRKSPFRAGWEEKGKISVETL